MLTGRFECGVAARWLPRVLAGAVLASGMIAASTIDPEGLVSWSGRVRVAMWVVSAALALAIVRGGAVLKRFAELGEENLRIGVRAHAQSLPYVEITDVRLVGPFAGGRSWAPTIAIYDRAGRGWSVPAPLRNGEMFVDHLLSNVGDEQVRAGAEARGVRAGLAWARGAVCAGYVLAGAVLLIAVLWGRP